MLCNISVCCCCCFFKLLVGVVLFLERTDTINKSDSLIKIAKIVPLSDTKVRCSAF